MRAKIKEKASKSVFIAAFVIIAAMLIGVTLWSIRAADKNVDEAVNSLSSFYMEELVGKRERVLKASLDKKFERLELFVSLVREKEICNQEELRGLLSDAQTLYGAKRLAMVDSDNTIYTANSTFSDASRFSFLQNDFSGPIIITSNLYGAKKQVIMAIPVDGIQLQDKELVACFMQIDIDDVAVNLTYEDENDSEKTFIGLYYKNGENLTTSRFDDLEAGQNLLEYFRRAQLSGADSFEEIDRSFRNGEEGLVTINSDGDTQYIYYTPVEGTDWMLTVMVHDNTIADQLEYSAGTMLRRDIVQMISTALIIVVVFVIIGSLNKRNGDMRRKQQELEERARNEEKLRLARDDAERANKAKTDFLFNMSHDIRTPMNAIIGFTDIAMKHVDEPERVADSLNKTKMASELLLSLINDILDMSRIESGKISLNENAGDVYLAFSGIESTMQELARAKDISLSFAINNIQDRYVYCDFGRCIRVFVNIITNAIKYTGNGGFVKVNCEQTGSEDGYGIYQFTFEDNGIGMSEEFLPRVFDEFSRENSATISGIQGTGLGLSVCRSFVEAMNGTITCRSKQGEGTVFTVTLPFRLQEGETYTNPENGELVHVDRGAPIDEAELAGKRILLVEDNELNLEIAESILSEEGIEVETADDGTVAVELMRSRGPDYYDCILMDIQMPTMNGYEATELIRKLYPEDYLPIIALSANAFAEDKAASLAAGMNDHVAKPINIVELKKTMAKHIKKK